MKRVLAVLFICVATGAGQTSPKHFLLRVWPSRGVAFLQSPTEAENKTMGEHAAYIKRLYDAGTVLLAGPSVNGEKTFGITVVRAADEAAARAILNGDPAVKGGIMQGEVLPFEVFVPPAR